MKIPKKVKVGGLTYRVIEKKKIDGSKRIHGLQKDWRQTIELKKDLAPEYKEKVFLHELIHAIFCACMIRQDEVVVETVAQSLYGVIKDNPGLFSEEGSKDED